MDIADQASDREMADREFALAAQRADKPYPASRSAWNAKPFKNIKGEPTHGRTS